ncbi:MAG: cytochrome c [Deltaproteobacteria bacterium]|nr:cytochrome c [Deltaproteobacteria bacterium]MBW2414923.1 cytochrome c [Deltaproteobacteria bacterium]
MSFSTLTRLTLALALCASPTSAAAQSTEDPTASLSPALRETFVAEMRHLDTGLGSAVSALAHADWAALEHTALEIKNSFILKQRLSPEQKAELHRVLPPAFLALDRRFHARAQRLADAARSADAELAAFHVYRLTEACGSCHAQYAKHRFPGFHTAPAEHQH